MPSTPKPDKSLLVFRSPMREVAHRSGPTEGTRYRAASAAALRLPPRAPSVGDTTGSREWTERRQERRSRGAAAVRGTGVALSDPPCEELAPPPRSRVCLARTVDVVTWRSRHARVR